MPRIARKPARNGKKTTKYYGWIGRTEGLTGKRYCFPLSTDRMASQAALNALMDAIERTRANIVVDVETLPPVVRGPFAKQRAGHAHHIHDDLQRDLAGHLDDWEQHLVSKGNSPDYISETKAQVVRVNTACRFACLKDIDPTKVERWLNLQDSMSSRTRAKHVTSLRGFGRWLVAVNRAASNPFEILKPGRVHKTRERRALSMEELPRFLIAACQRPLSWRETRVLSPSCIETMNNREIVYVTMIYTGLRINEIKLLEWRHVSFPAGRISLPSEATKSRKAQSVPMHREVAERLKHWLDTRNPDGLTAKVFDLPGSLLPTMRRDLEYAGIESVEDGVHVDVHSLRYTTATMLFHAGVHPKAAQRIMRHGSISLTMELYTRLSLSDDDSAMGDVPDLKLDDQSQAESGA